MQVSQFLIERLESAGVRHAFGIPGDYVLDFYKELWDSPKIEVVNNTDENHSGFAADAYARVNGIGCVVVTYSVGASKVINAVQCAYAERSPLVVISGAPGTNERNDGFLLHHMVRSFNSQKKMFDEITCASVVLDNPATAGLEIDRAFEALAHYKRPIYIELPRDVAKKAMSYDVYNQGTPVAPKTDPENLEEALKEVRDFMSRAERPAILAGVEIARFGLSEQLIRFAEKNNIPVASTLLSKSVVNERHPLFAGIYNGTASSENTRKIVDDSDCLLIFGDYHHDMTLCFRPAKFTKRQVVWANVEGLKVRNHAYPDVQFLDFAKALFRHEGGVKSLPLMPAIPPKQEFRPEPGRPVTNKRLFERINGMLDKNMAICADIGDALFGASDLTVHDSHNFLSPAFYTSMGPAIPYALGVQTAFPEVRPIVIVGDGAFQMSMGELGTIIERKLNPIVIVLNNDGYTTERFLMEGKFNDLRRWNYHKISELFGGGKGALVQTEDELYSATAAALDSKELFVLNVMLGRKDISQGLRRMTEALAKRV